MSSAASNATFAVTCREGKTLRPRIEGQAHRPHAARPHAIAPFFTRIKEAERVACPYAWRMSKSIISFGALLIVVGVVAYVATGMASVTALIPSFFGIVVILLGLLGRADRFERSAVYGALGVSVLGLLGSASGLAQVVTYLGGGEVERPAASITRAVMALILIVFVVVLTRSLAGKRRE